MQTTLRGFLQAPAAVLRDLCPSASSVVAILLVAPPGLRVSAASFGIPNAPFLPVLSPGEWIIAGAAAATALGGLLAFIRREARQQEPIAERKLSGGPVEISVQERCIERHEHDDLKRLVTRHKEETWEVINGLRRSVSKIEADIAGLRAQREANGERLLELSGDIKGLSKLVHRLAGVVEAKLEGPKD